MSTISYISYGKLGDLIDEMSVINEIFLNTGNRGNLYITGNVWSTTVENTFDYIKDVVSSQPYINNFKVYDNEPIDVNLDIWREYIYKTPHTFAQLMCGLYKIHWASHIWIQDIPTDLRWNNTVFINVTNYRPLALGIQKFINSISDKNICFIGNINEHYEDFKTIHDVNLPVYIPENFNDL
jgi:hypothetical protein